MTQSINQFAQALRIGMMDLRFNPGVVAAEIDVSEGGTLVPGQAVVVVDNAGGVPKVKAATVWTQTTCLFINYDIKTQGFWLAICAKSLQ